MWPSEERASLPELALSHFGIAVSVISLRRELLSDDAFEAVVAAFPRHNFKKSFHELLIDHATRNPTAYLFTWFHESLRALTWVVIYRPIIIN